jgi:hypothetical protein
MTPGLFILEMSTENESSVSGIRGSFTVFPPVVCSLSRELSTGSPLRAETIKDLVR